MTASRWTTMDGLSVRSATVEDSPAIARVHWNSWVATYRGVFPQRSFDEFPLANRERLWGREAGLNADPAQRSQLIVALLDGRVAGFAHVGPYRVQAADTPGAADDGELRALYLDPGLQRRGIGSRLWLASVHTLRSTGFAALRLWCIAGNEAEAFYRAMGARKIGSADFDAHGLPLRENCYRAETP
jgi:GNAT superfamily N-acetyltransferase